MIVLTFFTHHSAMMTHRTLISHSFNAKMAPVPRELSSSCGSCVEVYDVDEIASSLCDEDIEGIYHFDGKKFTQLFSAE
ncbi:MAG: DUF3343 domain-containing protein [Eubacteriales bacterium]|nr:DUF3343 domain-containing protein [Eubacteriales bacterium]